MKIRATLLRIILISQLAFIVGGCAGSRKQDSLPVTAAKQEALKHGWSRTEVDSCEFRDGIWIVHISKKPHLMVGTDAYVKVAPDGKVIAFIVNSE